MAESLVIGIPLGILIGILSGVVLIALIRSLARTPPRSFRQTLAVVSEILVWPGFWFGGAGGSWLIADTLQNVEWDDVLGPYVASLAISLLLIVAFPLVRFIIRIGREI